MTLKYNPHSCSKWGDQKAKNQFKILGNTDRFTQRSDFEYREKVKFLFTHHYVNKPRSSQKKT